MKITDDGLKVKGGDKRAKSWLQPQPRKKVIPTSRIGTCPQCGNGPCEIEYNLKGEVVANDCACQRVTDE